MKFDGQLEGSFYKRFKELNLKYLGYKKNYDIKLVKPEKHITAYDFSIEISKKTIAVIELKSKNLINSYDYSKIEEHASKNDIRYIVLSDGDNFIVTDREKGSIQKTYTFDNFVSLIQERINIDVDAYIKKIIDIIKQITLEGDFEIFKDESAGIIGQLTDSIEYDEIEQTFSFKNPSDMDNVENRIFRLLFRNKKTPLKIYRYTSLNSIYSMLLNNTFRMHCLVGMNDPTEVSYAENYITDTNFDFTQAHFQTIDAYNRRFISSCTLKRDDLTQWRLYADDSKGVCLVFTVNEDLLNSTFILNRISYGKYNGSHQILDFIKLIVNELKKQLDIDFVFRTLSTWRHFFKPHDYEVEDEVRLLYIHLDNDVKKSWLLTESNSILNPYVEFELNSKQLPLQLTEIILGPKCPEKEINKKQFESFIRELKNKKKTVITDSGSSDVDEYNLKKLTVSISKINNYR